MATLSWSNQIEKHDFDAGQRYLELLYPATRARVLVRDLKRTRVRPFAAKDILRASELELLSAKDPDVAKQLKHIAKAQALSPLLLVRESGHARVIVADGFHRLCAAMHFDQDAWVPCKIA